MKLQFHTDNEEIIKSVTAFIDEWNGPLSYFEVKTSGSTGTPRTIRIEKEYARASAQMTCDYLDITPGQQSLLCLSHETIGGKMMIIRSIERDLVLHVVAPSANPLNMLDATLDFIAMVPYQMQHVLDESPQKLSKKSKIIIGGGPVSSELEKKIYGVRSEVYHTFGMTETISHIALRNISEKKKAFEVLPGVTAEEKDGRLMISAPHLGVKRLETNDCIEMESANSFVWRGRLDFAVNSGGIKIHPEEVERALNAIINVPFFVIGEPDDQLGEKLVLCVESISFSLKKSELAEYLPKYHVPKMVYLYSRFIYTKSDKINRLATLESERLHEAEIL